MELENLLLVEVKFIDMYHFQLWEGKFEDLNQRNAGHTPKYIYANVSNFETSTFKESDLRVYSHSYDDLYCAEDYELVQFYHPGYDEICNTMKQQILKNIK